MSSRLTQARPAVRTALKGRMMLSGPPGSGKTRSGLIIATELAQGGPILGIDTEKESMATYADDFVFEHLRWLPPYNPRELAETINDAADNYAVIDVDSLSHFWRAEGGTLDIAGGKFTGWKDARPAQEELIEALLSVPAHVIVAVRSKVEYTQEQEANGRHVVKKLGMASVQDDTLEYEMNIAVDLAMDHTATVSKTRTTVLPVGRAFRAGHVVELAEIYREWLAGGEPPATVEQITELVGILNGIESDEQRHVAKGLFIDAFGRPETLTASKVDEALTFARDQAAGRREAPSLDEGTASTGLQPSQPLSAPPGGTGQLVAAIAALPEHVQEPCRAEIVKTFGALDSVPDGELSAALKMVEDWPAGPARSLAEAMDEAVAPNGRLSAKARGLLAYGRGHGLDQRQVTALLAHSQDTSEPKSLSDLEAADTEPVMKLVDQIKEGSLVFVDGPGGVLLVKEPKAA